MPWSFYDKNGNLKQAPASAVAPSAQISTTNAQSFTAATWVQALFNTAGTVDWDTGGLASLASSNITVPTAGRYHVSGGINQSTQVVSYVNRVKVNGTVRRLWTGGTGAATLGGGHIGGTVLNLAAGDVLTLEVFTSTTTTTSAANGGDTAAAVFSATKIDGATIVPVAYPASLVGQEVAYAEQTATVTATSSVATSGVTVVTSPSFTADGVSSYLVEFYSPAWRGSDSTNLGNLYLWQDGAAGVGTQLGIIAQTSGATVSNPVRTTRKVTPVAGSHTFTVAICDGGAATVHAAVLPGLGGAGNFMPASIRVTKAS